MLGLILNRNLFQFNKENYLQIHGTAMETKMAVSFANIFMAKIETMLSKTKATEWRRYIDNIFSLWDNDEKDVDQFIEQANKFHPTIKFAAERERDYFPRHSGVQRRKIKKNNSFWTSKLTTNLTFQYTHSNSCHPPSVKNGFIKGKVMRHELLCIALYSPVWMCIRLYSSISLCNIV